MFNTAMKDKMFKAAFAQRYGSHTGRLIITHADRERISKERAKAAKKKKKKQKVTA